MSIQRADYYEIAPKAMSGMNRLGNAIDEGTIDTKLRRLVEIRVSQINGCAYCCDTHSEQAREAGETQQRLDVLAAWHHANFFTEREQAALLWAEELTRIEQSSTSDDLYQQVSAHFTEQELVDLTVIINTMNAWNRYAIAFRSMTEVREAV